MKTFVVLFNINGAFAVFFHFVLITSWMVSFYFMKYNVSYFLKQLKFCIIEFFLAFFLWFQTFLLHIFH